MTRRLVVIAAAALVAAAITAGITAWISSHDLNQAAWAQTLDRDLAARDADNASARGTRATGDDPGKFLGFCRSAIAAYNSDAAAAGGDLPDGYSRHLNPDTECKATP